MKMKRSGGIKPDRTKKNTNIVLIIIASIAALSMAVFGILKCKGKKADGDKSKDAVKPVVPKDFVTTNEPDESKILKPARLEHRKINPGELDWETLAKEKEAEQIRKGEIPEYMLEGEGGKKPGRGLRRRKVKIAVSGIATVLVVAVVTGNVTQHLQPVEAMAKESFAGIGRIVEEHGENPYKILNIVPSKIEISVSGSGDGTDSGDTADSDPDNPDTTVTAPASFTFSTGTMGYLAGGKVPFADDLEQAFKGNPVFLHYASREELFNKLVPESSVNAFPWIKYEEAYGGVHNVSETNGWTLLFPNQAAVKEDGTADTFMTDKAKMSDGIFYGTYEHKSGDDTAGYDFVLAGGMTRSGKIKTALEGSIYGYVYNDNDGRYYAMPLADIPEGTAIYKAVVVKEIVVNGEGRPDGYSDDEDYYIYIEEAGRFDYVKNEDIYKGNSDGGNIIPEPSGGEETSDDVESSGDGSMDNIDTSGGGGNSGEGESNGGTETPGGGDDPDEGESNGDTDNPDIPDDSDTSGSGDPNIQETSDTTETLVTVIPAESVITGRNAAFTDGWRRLVEGDTDDIPEDGDSFSDNNDLTQDSPEIDPAEDDTSNLGGSAEGEGASDTTYYVLQFELIDADELAAFGMADDNASENNESDGISLLAASGSLTPDEKFIYVGSGKGDYKLEATGNKDDQIIGVYNAPIYFRCQAGNDWLRQYVFNSLSGGDNANSSFQIEVQTVRADEVTSEMVYEADLIYMESGQNMFLSSGFVSYIQPAKKGAEADDVTDMSEDTVSAILSRAAENLMPVIVDCAITEDTDNYADTNYQLLAKALLKRDLSGYFEAVKVNLMDNLAMNKDTDDYPDKDDNDYNYVNQNVYVINNEMLVSDDFAVYFDEYKAKAGFADVIAAIEAENTTLAEDDRISLNVSKARAIQYIINFSVGIIGEFEDLAILELQPTANISAQTGGASSDLHIGTDSKNNTKLYWKTESMKNGKQILYSKKPFAVTTDVKSVAEFNGEWNDINGTYDMIFIGLDGMNLNLNNDKPARPIYNNSDLNGKVYHLGDSSGSGTYDESDITSQKMSDLLDYLQAGYPIVVENDFFTEGTARNVSPDGKNRINTKYIDENTVMYHFLSAAVSDERYRESIFTVSDTMSSASYMVRMKTSKPRIELDSETATLQQLVLDENDEYHGRIGYQIKNNRDEEYLGSTAVHLYADMNHDGIFGENEELTEYANEGNLIDVAFGGMGPGIIPWKLEVTDMGNEYRRDSVQGYFDLLTSYEEEVRVLQVTNAKENPDIDLELMYNKTRNSMLSYYLKGAESNTKFSFEFKTITPGTLSERLEKNDKYLDQWDIVVLTADGGAAVNSPAIADYINKGRSLLVCSQNKSGSSVGLPYDLLGWSGDDRRTFVSLGASGLHRYAGLDSKMYEAQNGNLKAEKINEGSILYYPYQIGGSSFSLGSTKSGQRASEYLLDFDDNLKSNPGEAYVTAWLTLGGDTGTAYGISPRDARNNYYCYSKGNVVYLGQSEYPYTYDAENNDMPDDNEGADECRFFVNALMAAYSAGVHGSDVSIVSGFAQTSAPTRSISVPFDQEWRDTADDDTKGILDNTVDVYFKFADSNIGANKKLTVSFYYEDPAGEKEFAVGDRTIKAKQFASEIWTVTNNKLVPVTSGDPQNPDQIGLVPGKVYQIKVPVVPLKTLADDKTNNAGIYVLVESEFTRTGKPYKVEGFGTVSLNRASLFLLE